MNAKLAYNARKNRELNQMRREQINALMSLASLSMTGNRTRHTNTNPQHDQFNVEKLESEAYYLGVGHRSNMPSGYYASEVLCAPDFLQALQSALAPYEDYLGVINTSTTFDAVRLVLPRLDGTETDVWHYSIGFFDKDAFPSWLKFAGLRELCLHIALARVVRGEITREQFVMFCSDVVSSNSMLSLDKEIVHLATP